MIEMRWLVRQGWDGPERVLQYRQYVDATVYAQDPGGFVFPAQRNMQWSNWKDVPEVKE